jgi:hypothetical protein
MEVTSNGNTEPDATSMSLRSPMSMRGGVALVADSLEKVAELIRNVCGREDGDVAPNL